MPDDQYKAVNFNSSDKPPLAEKSLAALTGWDNEIMFRIQCKQIVKDSGLEGLFAGLNTIRACFQCALEVYKEELARIIKEKLDETK